MAVNTDTDPRQMGARKDIEEFFQERRHPDDSEAADHEEEDETSTNVVGGSSNDYSWQSPTSWGFLSRDTYAMNARPRRSSQDRPVDLENLWALRIFKPVETSDGVMSKIMASSGYTYVTISCDLDSTAAEICQMLIRKFTSNRDLSRFRLYVVHRNTERLLDHHDQPAQLLRSYLLTMGYTEEDQLNKIAREDHSYCCRFIFREYPPAPPKSEDFTEPPTSSPVASVSKKGSASQRLSLTTGRARITQRSAYLADVNLSVMPTIMFQNAKHIEFIDLSRNTLLTLPDDLFEMLINLRLLRIIGNQLASIPKAILACPSITHLDLSSNKLDGEALGTLATMPRLTHLNVSCNRITKLPDSLASLVTLRSLDISSNYLTALSPCIWGMQDLRELNASFNRITSVPEEIVSLRYLRCLIMVGNAIESLNPQMKELVHLRQLDLRGNLLTRIDGIDAIASLFEVSLDYNHLSDISHPSWPHMMSLSCVNNSLTGLSISDYLYSLKKLNLSSSKIVSLPDDIFAYTTNLEILILQQNELTRLPQSINLLSRLERLHAHSNSIVDANLHFSYLTALTHLELHTNNIRSINGDIWNAPSLKVLNVSSNFLTSFPQAPISMTPLPLATSLEELLAADNRLADDISDVIVLLRGLRVLNLSYNRIFDLGDCLRESHHLVELYVAGNGLTAFPEDIDRCTALRMLFINGNKLTNLPAELGRNAHLAVFDAQSNALKYNIANWPYDWNWNFNGELQYLNLANNKRLEIKSMTPTPTHHHQQGNALTLTDFKSMHKLRLLDVTNVQVSPACLPEGVTNLQTRLSEDQVGLKVSVADYCGREILFDISEFVTRSFMGQEKDHLVGLFDGRGHDFVASYLNDTLEDNLKLELRRLRQGELFSVALRRAFLSTNRDLSMQPVDMKRGSTACLLYLLENQLLVANVGDTMAVLSREGTAYILTTKHHPWARGEQARIRNLGGFISLQGLVEQDLPITRAFGHHHLLPYVNACPSINEIMLGPKDEFVLVATASFWEVMSYQMAVDVARKERSDPDVAVQKLRDMAVARGVTNSMKIMLIDFRGVTSAALDTDSSVTGTSSMFAERRKNAFRRQDIDDQVLSRLDDETPPPKPPCAFVFTDIKDSTKLWSLLPNAMRVAIKQHNNIMRRLMRIHGGYEVKTEGDAFVVAFQSSVNALKFCLSVQTQFLESDWPREILESPVCATISDSDGHVLYRGLSIRMGVHFGMADDEEDKVARRMDYHGIHMIIASRVSALADGGQINITETIRDAFLQLPERERPDVVIYDVGMTPLKGLQNPEHLFVVYPRPLAERHQMRRDSIGNTRVDRFTSQLSTLSIAEEPTEETVSEADTRMESDRVERTSEQ